MSLTPDRRTPNVRSTADWVFFLPYAAVSIVHVVLLASPAQDAAALTKLLLMPLLAVAAALGLRGRSAFPVTALVLVALALSWIGDGAATFVPFAPTIPVMLAAFGAAHLAYIALFVRYVRIRPFPVWALAYAVWWLVLLLVLLPHLGDLTLAVAAYGVVLAGTAATAARAPRTTAIGAAFFLASDTILAFRLFVSEAMPEWTSPAVMVTYTLGQGLIVYGVVTWARLRPTTLPDERQRRGRR